ncbi:MAG: FISUMP domain-containing protein [Bacteroidota bacterium]
MKDLDLLKKKLKSNLPSKGVKSIIRSLKEILPEDSHKFNTLISLEAEQKELLLKSLKKVLSEEQMQRANADIRDRLLSFIDALEKEDFEKNAPKSNFSNGKNYKKGHVLYQIPKQMQVLKETRCRVRIAFDEMMLIEDLEMEDDIEIKSNLRVSDYMRVDIIDPSAKESFKIRTTSDPIQFIDQDDFTEWRFYVKPLLPGEHTLELKVALIILINGKEIKREKTLEESVVIIADEVPKEEVAFVKAEDNFIVTEASTTAATTPKTSSLHPTSSRFSKSLAMGLVFLMLSSSLSYAFVPSFNERVNWFVTNQVKADKEAYEGYIKKYRSKEASSEKIKKHLQIALKKVQAFDFKEALEDTTVEESLDYLDKYEQGKYTNEVKEHLVNLKWSAIQATTNLTMQKQKLTDFLTNYPNNKWETEAKNLLEVLNAVSTPKDDNKVITSSDDRDNLTSDVKIGNETTANIPTVYGSTNEDEIQKLKRELNDSSPRRRIKILGNIGSEYFKRKAFSEAIIWYKKAIEASKKSNITDYLPSLYSDVAQSYFEQNAYTDAITFYQKTLDLFYSEKSTPTRSIVQVIINISDIYLLQNNLNESKKKLLEAIRYLNKNDKNEDYLGLLYLKLSRLSIQQNDKPNAKKYLLKSIEYLTPSQKPESKNLLAQAESLKEKVGLDNIAGATSTAKTDNNKKATNASTGKKEQNEKDAAAMAALNETNIAKEAGLEKSYFIDERDQQHYSIVLVDDLWWMARNLSYEAPESGCYDTSGRNCNRFGKLYTWRSAKRACPEGWRLPTDKEWADMTRSLYGSYTECKDCFRGLVKGGESGLNILLGGRRFSNGRYGNLNEFGFYWTATELTPKEARVYMFSSRSQIMLREREYKTNALSCRCVKER